MALKVAKDLKKGDKFFYSTLSGSKAIAFWAEILGNNTLRHYDTGSMKHREIHEVSYKITTGPKAGETHTTLLNPTDKMTVPDRPAKLIRIWREIVSK